MDSLDDATLSKTHSTIIFMFFKKISTTIVLISTVLAFFAGTTKSANKLIASENRPITLSSHKLSITLDYEKRVCISSLVVNGQKVISTGDGIFTSLKVGSKMYSSLHLKSNPVLVRKKAA